MAALGTMLASNVVDVGSRLRLDEAVGLTWGLSAMGKGRAVAKAYRLAERSRCASACAPADGAGVHGRCLPRW